MTKITIGIQARSTSTRLPNKIEAIIGEKTCLQHVIDSCYCAAQYLNKWSSKSVAVNVALVVPMGDPLSDKVAREIDIVEGPEDDVLSRYMLLLGKTDADYICRITSDCPLIPHFIISKLITIAVMNRYDYVSNVDERCRTAADGMDCEVISRRAMGYLNENAFDKKDREHVTTYLRRHPPAWFLQGMVINFLDLSSEKLSVDTASDLDRVRSEHNRIEDAYIRAVKIFGKKSVHRF